MPDPRRARNDHTAPARRVHWYHPACIFKSFERAAKTTKTIDSVDDMEGFSDLKDKDKADLTARVAAWVARKAALDANYKPKKRKRQDLASGNWIEPDEEAVDLLVAMASRPSVARPAAASSVAAPPEIAP